jgi:FkbM family methyltransferase
MLIRQIDQFPGPIRMIQGRHGPIFYNQNCQYIGKALELYGEYCEHEIHLFKALIEPSNVIWEIGANTGSQSTALASMVPHGTFVGFEPQIELYKIFVTNLTVNNCENAIPMNHALGEVQGVIPLPLINYHLPNNFGAVSLLNKNIAEDSFLVETSPIDKLTWLPPPDFMKIDVEGMESNVLRGGNVTIIKKKPIIYIENDRPDKSSELISILWDFGYICYWHITPYFNSENYFGNKKNIYQNQASFNMLCIHNEKESKAVEGLKKIIDKDFHPLKK